MVVPPFAKTCILPWRSANEHAGTPLLWDRFLQTFRPEQFRKPSKGSIGGRDLRLKLFGQMLQPLVDLMTDLVFDRFELVRQLPLVFVSQESSGQRRKQIVLFPNVAGVERGQRTEGLH